MPVLVRSSILCRVGGVKRSVSAVGFGVVVCMMSGLVFLGWWMEVFTFLEKWPGWLVSISDTSFQGSFES